MVIIVFRLEHVEKSTNSFTAPTNSYLNMLVISTKHSQEVSPLSGSAADSISHKPLGIH